MEKNRLLRNAIKWLKGNGEIKYNKDVADALGCTKGKISNYITNVHEVTADFIIDFEQKFLTKHRLTLEHFYEIKPIKKPAPLSSKERDSILVTTMTQLQKALELQAVEIQELKEMVKSLMKG